MLSFFPRGVLDEILNLIESGSEDFLSYSSLSRKEKCLPKSREADELRRQVAEKKVRYIFER